MNTILKLRNLTILLGLALLCSCATKNSNSCSLPADVTIDDDAGRGSWLIVMLRLDDERELPFMVDTGTADTFVDKSLEQKLGKRLGSTKFSPWGVTLESDAYAAPRLFLGNTQLKAGRFVYAIDWLPKSRSGRPIKGVLGMDCLKHYCLQLDFAARKMRFLNPDLAGNTGAGKTFPLTFKSGRPFIHHPGLLGGKSTHLLIDSGFDGDGAVERWELQSLSAGRGKTISPEWRLFPEGTWDGQTYQNLMIGTGGNIVGLRFMARHLVTLNFPKQTMHLKQSVAGLALDNAAKQGWKTWINSG